MTTAFSYVTHHCYAKNNYGWQPFVDRAGGMKQIATVPQVLRLRTKFPYENEIWHRWFVTTSAEYVGLDRNDKLQLVVAHGVGPLMDLDYVKRNCKNKGNDLTIPQEDFLNLLDGHYGEVEIIPMQEIWDSMEYPFMEHNTDDFVLCSNFAQARLGLSYKELQQFINLQQYIGKSLLDPINSTRKNYDKHFCFTYNKNWIFYDKPDEAGEHSLVTKIEKIKALGSASAQYLVVDNTYTLCCSDGTIFSTPIGLAAMNNDCTQLIGLPVGCNEADIDNFVLIGERIKEMQRSNPEKFQEVPKYKIEALQELVKKGHTYYAHNGGSNDVVATSVEEMNTTTYVTKIIGYHGIFRHDAKELLEIAPKEANAFIFSGEPYIYGNYHKCLVTFYKVSWGKSRLLSATEIWEKFPLSTFL